MPLSQKAGAGSSENRPWNCHGTQQFHFPAHRDLSETRDSARHRPRPPSFSAARNSPRLRPRDARATETGHTPATGVTQCQRGSKGRRGHHLREPPGHRAQGTDPVAPAKCRVTPLTQKAATGQAQTADGRGQSVAAGPGAGAGQPLSDGHGVQPAGGPGPGRRQRRGGAPSLCASRLPLLGG